MLHPILGCVGTFTSFFGIFTNLYVLLVLLFSKKTRSSSEWILLHLSSCGLAASVNNLVGISPSVFLQKWVAVRAAGCNLVGGIHLALQLLIVYSVCALSADRCGTIVSPLRYPQVITRKKIAGFFISIWIVAISIVLASFLIKPSIPEMEAEQVIKIARIVPVQVEEGDRRSPLFPFTTTNEMMEEAFSAEDLSRSNATSYVSNFNEIPQNLSEGPFLYRPVMGVCLPRTSGITVFGIFWVTSWTLVIFVVPMITLLCCDLTVLSIARKQRHRIIMALYQITAVTQVTVTGSKGTPLPGLWLNRSVPAKSRACRAVWEDMITLTVLHLPLILILVLESTSQSQGTPEALDILASLSLFITPSLTAILYGIRARPLRAAYKSYLRKRLTNSTLQHEIQQRLSPVDGSPRLSASRIKSFRSSSPSPNSSPSMTPTRRMSTNDLRPPEIQHFTMTISPSHGTLGSAGNHRHSSNHVVGGGKDGMQTRKVRSFLHIPSQLDMQEFWSGLRRPNRSPTIIITHEIKKLDGSPSSSHSPSPHPPEQKV